MYRQPTKLAQRRQERQRAAEVAKLNRNIVRRDDIIAALAKDQTFLVDKLWDAQVRAATGAFGNLIMVHLMLTVAMTGLTMFSFTSEQDAALSFGALFVALVLAALTGFMMRTAERYQRNLSTVMMLPSGSVAMVSQEQEHQTMRQMAAALNG